MDGNGELCCRDSDRQELTLNLEGSWWQVRGFEEFEIVDKNLLKRRFDSAEVKSMTMQEEIGKIWDIRRKVDRPIGVRSSGEAQKRPQMGC